MLRIQVDQSRFGKPLAELAKRLDDPAEVLEAIGKTLDDSAKLRHSMRVDPDGQPWALWADSTRESYPFPGTLAAKSFGKAGNGRLLDRYGDMLGDLNHQVEGDEVRVGFGKDYAIYHEWGTKHMPRRGLLMSDPDTGTLGAEDEASVLDLVSTWLDELLG